MMVHVFILDLCNLATKQGNVALQTILYQYYELASSSITYETDQKYDFANGSYYVISQ